MANGKKILARPLSALRYFLDNSASGGIVLIGAAALALVVANSPAAESYNGFLHSYVGKLSVLHWINDGLMALFFLLVGLEIKREMLDGQLSTWSRRILPGFAALGGMIGPAIVFLAFNFGEGGHPKGWAVPTATDIAFALGVLSLIGSRVPMTLRVFLTALAIIDDLGAVVIIALFYTNEINMVALSAAVVVTLLMVGLNRRGVVSLLPYLILAAILWACVLLSGVHATIAGVVAALTIPLKPSPGRPDAVDSPLHKLEHALQPWVTFLIVPLFGFANAGVSFAGMSPSALLDPVPLGVALGLFFGKQIGVFLAGLVAVRMKWASLPMHATWIQFYGVAVLCGIGFTMSLFIGLLAFPGDALLQDEVKLGVLLGSLVSALLGSVVLYLAPRRGQIRPTS